MHENVELRRSSIFINAKRLEVESGCSESELKFSTSSDGGSDTVEEDGLLPGRNKFMPS